MKIRILTPLSGDTVSHNHGDITDAYSDQQAQRLIDAGYAEIAGQTPPEPATVNGEPEPLPDDLPGHADLTAARLIDLRHLRLLHAAGFDFTSLNGIGDATAKKLAAYLKP